MVRWPWLGGLALVAGALLPAPTAGADDVTGAPVDDARVLLVEVNQGSGDQNDLPTFAAGSPTVVTVYADTTHGFVPVHLVLHGYHLDGEVMSELPDSPQLPSTALAPITLGPSDPPTETQFVLPPSWTTGGDLALTAELLPVHTYASSGAECRQPFCPLNNTKTVSGLHFVDTGVVRLHEVSETGFGGSTLATMPTVDGVVSDLQALQPFRSGDLHFARSGEVSLADLNGTVPRSRIPMLQCFSTRQPEGCPKGPDADNDGSVDSIDPRYVSTQSVMFTGLARLDLLTAGERCNGSTLPTTCFDDALGMAPNLPSGRTLGGIGNESEGLQQVAIGKTGGRGTVHEFSHSLGRGHINAPPGCASDEVGTPNGVDDAWPYADNTINVLGIDTRPNSGGAGAFREVASTTDAPVYDVMTYCHADNPPVPPATDWWVSDYGRNLAMSYLAARQPAPDTVAQPGIEIRATYDVDGDLHAYVFPAVDVPFAPDPEGGHTAVVTNIAGTASWSGTLHVGGVGLYGFVPMPVDTTPRLGSVTIDGVDVLDASASTPTVNRLSVTRLLNGSYRVDWGATDPDGDPLIVAVDYGSLNGSLRTLWVGPDDNHPVLTFTPDMLTGTTYPRFRVRVGDGMLWGSRSTILSTRVPEQKPSVFIGDPTRSISVNQGNSVTLTGSATDQGLQTLFGTELTWKDGSRVLGTGSLLQTRQLRTVGPHTVTLTARDAAGNVRTVSTTVTVRATAPVLRNLTASATATTATLSFTPMLAGVLGTYGAGTIPVIRSFAAVPTTIQVPLTTATGSVDVHLVVINGAASSQLTVTIDRSVVDIP